MVRIYRLLYTSPERSIHRLLRCVKTFGHTPVPLPEVRDEVSDIRLNRPELTAASLAKFTISPLIFEHSSGCEKLESEKLKKVKFLRSYFIFVTFLPKEVDERLISEIYFWMKIEYEVLTDSRS